MNEEESAASATATTNKNKQLITMNKLGFLCEIKAHMADVNSLRKRIREEVDLINLEERCLAEFKREMESLNQEKMTHVEELRQIHSDINMLDNVQKQSEEDRNRRLEAVKEAYHQLTAIKGKVDKMCLEVEMPRMYENEEEQFELGDKRQMILSHSGGGGGGGKGSSGGGGDSGGVHEGGGGVHHHHPNPHGHGHGPRSMAEAAAAAQVRGGGGGGGAGGNSGRPLNDNTNTPGNAGGAGGAVGGAFSSSLASLMSGFQERHQPPYGRMLSGGQGGGGFHNEQNAGVNQGVGGSSQGAASAAAAAFRQQPPPMKSCGSCHQQIHRNAPICPLCKAKSRSRHPKRRNNSQRN